ncbi:hypothetical protein N7512_001391 [Penicillium capsulatum]|nr:hypothetical protein N7512_001391 [Penicillium capsulatum]
MANDQTVAVDTDIGIATVTDRTWYTCMDPHQYAHSNEFVPKLITIHNTDIGEREQIQICPWSLRARTAWFNMGEADFVSHLAVDTPEEAMAIFRTDHISDWALLDFDLVHEVWISLLVLSSKLPAHTKVSQFSHVYGTEDHAYTWQDCLNLSDGLGAENAST